MSSEPLTGHVMEPIKILQGDDYLQSALNGQHIDFMKIDVEGYELEVLAGLKQTIDACRPIVTLELNHWCLNAFQRMSVPEFIDRLCDIFPILYAVHDGHAADLHDSSERYHVTYRHILHFQYSALVAAFDASQLRSFLQAYVTEAKPRAAIPDPHARIAVLERERLDLERERDELEQTLISQREACRTMEEELSCRLAVAIERANLIAAELEAIRNSTSWRVTKPLRVVKALIQ